MLLGIGNELRGDDGVGNVIAREIAESKPEGWLSVPCETVPENFTGLVKQHRPGLLVLVDAADMGLQPGEFRIIPPEKLDSDVLGTHGMPLRHLVTYLRPYAGKTIFIGVQPGKMTMGKGMSEELIKSKSSLKGILVCQLHHGIKRL